MVAVNKLVLCTTFYPAVEPFLSDWYASLANQTDRDHEIRIALDGLDVDRACDAMGGRPDAAWVHAEPGDTPATIRQKLLAPVLNEFDGIVLVDSDDILHPDRVSSARKGLQQYDLVACALQLVDHEGNDLDMAFSLPADGGLDDILPRYNIFGLSNTAWRSDLLVKCLPVPADVEIVDWFLATRAWLIGAGLGFDEAIGMSYRQHASNMVRVYAPFDLAQIVRDTERVRRHFRLVQISPPDGTIATRLDEISRVADDVERFAERIVADPARLDEYAGALNQLDLAPLWWTSVAHPALDNMWT